MKTKKNNKINGKTHKINKYRKHRKSRKGGNIIGKGKDGFIIDTIMYNNYNINNGYVSKIFKKGINVNKELNNKLKEIDPHEERFYIILFQIIHLIKSCL